MYDEVDLSNATLIIADRFGVYIPQRFARCYSFDLLGLSEKFQDDYKCILQGPSAENEWYWDAWQSILDNATLKDTDGIVHYLYQDGDLWAVPKEA